MASTAAAKKKASNKSDKPPNYWRAGRRHFTIADEEFHVVGIASGKRKDLDAYVTALSWTDDADNRMTGTITLQRLGATKDQGSIGIGMGHRIQVYYRVQEGRGPWKPLWRMYVRGVNRDVMARTVELTLVDESFWLRKSIDTWKFSKTKRKGGKPGGKHPKGWKPYQIVRAVCRRYGVKLAAGKVYKGRHYTTVVKNKASPWDVLIAAYKTERRKTGKRFIVSMKNGRLNITPLKYSTYLYEIGDLVLGASVTEEMPSGMFTDLTVRATRDAGKKKGKKNLKKKKIKVRVKSRALVRRYGRIYREITVDADSASEARREGKRWMAKKAKPRQEVTFSHPGIVAMQRGTAMRLYFPQENFKQVVFVSEVTHNVSPGDYTMEVTVRFDDPYKDARAEREKAMKCAAARRRRRKPPAGCPAAPKKQPASADTKGDAK